MDAFKMPYTALLAEGPGPPVVAWHGAPLKVNPALRMTAKSSKRWSAFVREQTSSPYSNRGKQFGSSPN